MRSVRQGIGATLVAVLALAAGPAAELATSAAPPREGPVIRIATRTLEAQPYEATLPEKVGVLESAQALDVSFEVGGRIDRIAGDGAAVEAGGEVAALDSAFELAELVQAELRLEEARRESVRIQGLIRSNAASHKALQAAETTHAVQLAALDARREQLARRRIAARFSGIVTDVRFDPGEVATPGALVARLQNFDLMKLEVGVPGYQVVHVAPGARVRIAVPALGGASFTGNVLSVARAAAEGEHLFEVEIVVPNLAGKLRPGMSARAHIVTRHLPSVLVAPLSAAVGAESAWQLYFSDGERAHAVPIDEAAVYGSDVVLPDTLPYRALILHGQHDLWPGARIEADGSILKELPGAQEQTGNGPPADAASPSADAATQRGARGP